MVAHPALAEMNAVAADARAIIERVDIRHTFALDTPGAWDDLLEAMIRQKFDANLPKESYHNLRRMAERWKHLYRQLAFSACTRPGWIT